MRALRLVLGVLLWVLVLGLSSLPVSIARVRGLMMGSSWLSGGTLVQVTMLATSLVLMLIIGKGKLKRYGFRMVSWSEMRTVLIFGSVASVVIHVVLAVIWRFLPSTGPHPTLAGSSLLKIVLTVWVLASICEEVLHRGLIQSFLDPLRDYAVAVLGIRLSLPVVTAGVLFGASHIMLLTTGADGYLVGGIVGSAAVLGLVAGYYREATGSLLPAIVVHMLFNAYGGVSQYIQNLLAG